MDVGLPENMALKQLPESTGPMLAAQRSVRASDNVSVFLQACEETATNSPCIHPGEDSGQAWV